MNSFISNNAVRKCISEQEAADAKSSNRIIRCRWVLTWKSTPDEGLAEAQQEVREQPEKACLTSDGRRNAKARIVLLGFGHPDLLSEEHKTASPVQAVLTRNLSYQMVMQNGWSSPYSPDFYGSTTAPRNLWENVDKALVEELGAVRTRGDKCFWLWIDPDSPRDALQPLGFMGGHVDDFHRAGNMKSTAWQAIRKRIDQRYRWGTTKMNQYRHAGTDLTMTEDPQHGRCLVVDQPFYIETLQDVDISASRMSQPAAELTASEIAACRASLGAIQWLAVQTQPLVCARCGLLVSELSRKPIISTAQEIQELVEKLRRESTILKFFRIPDVQTWRQMVVIGLGDQAHMNRARGDSTGGMAIFFGGPVLKDGRPGPMTLVHWKSWRLRRVSISTNDAEVQALVETEDVLFRTKLLWAEMHGTGAFDKGRDFLLSAEGEARQLDGILGTDSKGGYDSIMVNVSPFLGLTNMRAAIQADQLKQALPFAGTVLYWLASDWNLSDALTKEKDD